MQLQPASNTYEFRRLPFRQQVEILAREMFGDKAEISTSQLTVDYPPLPDVQLTSDLPVATIVDHVIAIQAKYQESWYDNNPPNLTKLVRGSNVYAIHCQCLAVSPSIYWISKWITTQCDDQRNYNMSKVSILLAGKVYAYLELMSNQWETFRKALLHNKSVSAAAKTVVDALDTFKDTDVEDLYSMNIVDDSFADMFDTLDNQLVLLSFGRRYSTIDRWVHPIMPTRLWPARGHFSIQAWNCLSNVNQKEYNSNSIGRIH